MSYSAFLFDNRSRPCMSAQALYDAFPEIVGVNTNG